MRWIEMLDLLLKHKENAVGRFAGLELGNEWVREKVLLCASFILFQGITENLSEVGGRCGNGVRARHRGSEECIRVRVRRMVKQ